MKHDVRGIPTGILANGESIQTGAGPMVNNSSVGPNGGGSGQQGGGLDPGASIVGNSMTLQDAEDPSTSISFAVGRDRDRLSRKEVNKNITMAFLNQDTEAKEGKTVNEVQSQMNLGVITAD